MLMYFRSPRMTFAIISGECTPATPEDTISNQLISRPHELQLFSSPLSHSGGTDRSRRHTEQRLDSPEVLVAGQPLVAARQRGWRIIDCPEHIVVDRQSVTAFVIHACKSPR